MRTLLVLSLLAISGAFPDPAAAAGMRLERERLFTMEGPETVGFLKRRFDFQHNFKDYTLNPAVDLTLVYGVWDTVQIEIETLLHNLKASTFGKLIEFQYNVVNYGLKWAILDQTKEHLLSLVIGGALGRTDTKSVFRDPAAGVNQVKRDHHVDRGGYILAHYDWARFSQYVTVQYASFRPKSSGQTYSVTTPGIGERIKLYKTKDVQIHLVGDYHFKTFDVPGAENAWGAGAQIMYHSPHVFSFFVGNTFGDPVPDGLFGIDERFYNFRWSYRF